MPTGPDTEEFIDYHASATLSRFHRSDAFVRGVMGPVGSGKSTAMCWEIWRRAHEQEPSPVDGVRRTRWAIIRNTYRELEDTTMKTWSQWFGAVGRMVAISKTWRYAAEGIEIEVLFRALDKPTDVKKLLSLELTGAWINEAREVPKGVLDALGDRVGRYPAMIDGGAVWSGIFMDTNPPDEDHWWYRLAEEETPPTWRFFRQPGGVVREPLSGGWVENPKAENLANLPAGYYLQRLYGKSQDHIKIYYAAEYGFVVDGKPVWPEYADATHCQEVRPDPRLPIYVGMDFGLTPAAVIAQRGALGDWRVLAELVTEDMGAERFAQLLHAELQGAWGAYQIAAITGDPAGEGRAQTDEQTAFMIMAANGVKARPARTNDFTQRREAVATMMNRISGGVPLFRVSPQCRQLRKALSGGYCYRRLQITGDERFHDVPDKGKYSHVADALQYCLLGAGEGEHVVIRRSTSGGALRVITEWDALA